MNVYIAGIYTSNFHRGGSYYSKLTDRERLGHDECIWRLESYHYIHKQAYVDRIRETGDKVFLDSGAFSAFTLGKTIDLPAYCDYIHRNSDIIAMASVLDGIGDPLKTYQNQLAMEELGTRPLPCFHYGEDERYLEYYMANYEYITLGGMVPISTPQLIHWLDRLWDKYLTDGSGRPRLKVHGFGLTSVPLMMRYPWFSVDSSSWVQLAAFGNIFIPGIGMVSMSDRSPSTKVEGKHFDNITPIERERVAQILTSQGYDPERMRTINYPRWAYNVWAYTELGRMTSQVDPNFKAPQEELF